MSVTHVLARLLPMSTVHTSCQKGPKPPSRSASTSFVCDAEQFRPLRGGESLFFAPPKKSNQKKGGPVGNLSIRMRPRVLDERRYAQQLAGRIVVRVAHLIRLGLATLRCFATESLTLAMLGFRFLLRTRVRLRASVGLRRHQKQARRAVAASQSHCRPSILVWLQHGSLSRGRVRLSNAWMSWLRSASRGVKKQSPASRGFVHGGSRSAVDASSNQVQRRLLTDAVEAAVTQGVEFSVVHRQA